MLSRVNFLRAPVAGHETAPYRPMLLRASGVCKRFGALVALDSFDFDVPRYSVVSLIGPNGAGKTVFFNILTGLLKPDGGTIWFNGRNITGLPPDRVTALGIARTFQNVRLFPNMTVLENVLVGQHSHIKESIVGAILRTRSVVAQEARAVRQARELLDFIGLADQEHLMAKHLPYGDARRLEVARALASNPALLLLDEPTAGMNPHETIEMIELIARLRRECALTVLLIEHDMKVVMRISDRVSVLDYGVKIAEGTPDEVRANPRVVEAYLGRSGVAASEALRTGALDGAEAAGAK